MIPVAPPAPRVLIANDSPPTRLGVRTLLEEEGFAVCAEAPDSPAAVEAAARERPDVCLLEIQIPGDAIAAISAIAASAPDTAVVVLTASHDEAVLLQALQAGAAGYILLEDADAESLAHALHAVLRGEATLPRRFLPTLAASLPSRPKQLQIGGSRPPLTTREEEILGLLGEGLTTAQIAERLFVSQVTVRTHICSILKKLDVRDRQSAIRLLLDPPSGATADEAPTEPSLPPTGKRSLP